MPPPIPFAPPPGAADVPLVGQPVEIIEARPLITCRCRACEDGPPLLFVHATQVVTCRCGRQYVIALLHFERHDGTGDVAGQVRLLQVGHVAPPATN